MKLGRLLSRLVIGGLMFGHGAQKLFGWFGGHGPDGTGQFFESLGLRPGRRNAIAAGAAEALGGALLIAGALTPVAGAAVTGSMVTAIRTAHWSKGVWVTSGGFEYNLVLIAATAHIVEDEAGTGWMLASIAAGAAGSELAMLAAGATGPSPAERAAAGEPPRFSRDGDAEPAPAVAGQATSS